jgi:hypothetical protein
MVYRAYERYAEGSKPAATAEASSTKASEDKGVVDQVKSTVGSLISPSGGTGEGKPLTPEQYLERRKPRVPDLPSSAPVYDQLTQPVSHPRVYCLSTADPRLVARRPPSTVKDGVSSQCYTQQGSKFGTSFDFCLSVARDGYFDPTLPDRNNAQDQRLAQPQTPAQPLPENTSQQANAENYGGPRVTVIPHQKGEFLW